MSIRSTGPISFSDINQELGYVQTRTLSLGDDEVRSLAAGIVTASSEQTVQTFGNIIIQSENFGAARWTKFVSTVQVDQEVAPDGTTTADKLTSNGGGSFVQQDDVTTIRQNVQYRHSVYLKGFGTSVGRIVAIGNFDFGARVGVTSLTLTANWQRLSAAFTGTATVARDIFIQLNGFAGGAANATLMPGQSVFAWGYQITTGSTLQAYNEYTRTTSTTRTTGTITTVVSTTAAATVVAGAISMNRFYGATR